LTFTGVNRLLRCRGGFSPLPLLLKKLTEEPLLLFKLTLLVGDLLSEALDHLCLLAKEQA
jgi:hypothetical protein